MTLSGKFIDILTLGVEIIQNTTIRKKIHVSLSDPDTKNEINQIFS